MRERDRETGPFRERICWRRNEEGGEDWMGDEIGGEKWQKIGGEEMGEEKIGGEMRRWEGRREINHV